MNRRSDPSVDIEALLQDYADGAILDTLNHDLRTVARAVQRTGKNGSLTLTVVVTGGGDKMVKLKLEAKAKVPRPALGARELYVHEDGELRGHHPEQKKIAFDVDAAKPGKTEPEGGDL